MNLSFKLSQAILGACLTLVGSQACAQNYQFTDLGTLGGVTSSASAINNLGQIVGQSALAGGAVRATLWQGDSKIDLGVLQGGDKSQASGINDLGQVVGSSTISSGATHATLFNVGSTPQDLGTLGGRNSYASAINGSGQIVGAADVLTYTPKYVMATHAALWSGGQVSDLGTLGGAQSYAWGINDLGTIVGVSNVPTRPYPFPTVWVDSVPTSLATPDQLNAKVNAINNAGVAVGFAETNTTNYHAALWRDGQTVDLSPMAGSMAFGINNGGQIVGTNGSHAVLWFNSSETDLNDLLDADSKQQGWVLRDATGINDLGWIVGNAFNYQTQQTHAYLMAVTSVPEASSFNLMLLGVLGICVSGLRQNSKRAA